MRTTKKTRKILFYGTLLFLFMQLPIFSLVNREEVGSILYLFLLAIVMITLWSGAVVGLIVSLVFIFISGSLLLYFSIAGIPVMDTYVSLQLFIGYGFMLLLLIFLAAKLREELIWQDQTISRLDEEVKKYVAIDVDTGFENEIRMRLSVNEEMRRSDRYKDEFVFILLKVENYKNFEQLYGVNETRHLWKQLADKIERTVRLTDKKFRYGDSYIGLLLTNTSDEYIDVVYEKLDQTLKNHQLLNGRWVTLSYKASYFLYTPLLDHTFDELLLDLEREVRTNEL